MATRGDEVDLELEVRLDRPDMGLLEHVAFTLGSTLDVKEVLRRLAEIVHRASAAQRCSIVLIEDERLRPAVAIGGHPDDDLWSAFRSMPPIELGADEWMLLQRGRALAYEDARTSPYIPPSWIERFSLRAIALVPLVAHGTPCGVMAVDWPEVRPIPSDELAQLEAIGTYAGIAVHNARLHERVARKGRTLEHMVEVAASLNSSRSLSTILDRICDGFQQLLGAAHVSVNLTDPANPLEVRTLATRGEPWFARDRGDAATIPPEELLASDEMWRDEAGPIVYPRLDPAKDTIGRRRALRSAALFPLFGQDGLIGSVLAGFPRLGGPDREDVDTGQTLAELAAAAIGRADVDEQLRRRLRQLEILAGLSEVVVGTADLDAALAGVNKALGTDLGIELLWVAVPNRKLRDLLGGRAPDDQEARAIRSWRALLGDEGRRLGLRPAGDDLLVPVVHRDQVQGALRVRQKGEPVLLPDEEFLMAVGAACAEVVYRAGLSDALRSSEARLVIAAERDRIAQDLHDSAGQLLVALGLDLAEYAGSAPDDHWRQRLERSLDMARRSEQELRDAVHALLFMQVRERGLVESVEELAEHFKATTGIDVTVEVGTGTGRYTQDREEALFRVAHEALANVGRHSLASRVEIRLTLDDDHGLVEVRDDGLGLSPYESDKEGHYGLQALGRRLAAVGGALHTGNGAGGGVVVAASVPGGLEEK